MPAAHDAQAHAAGNPYLQAAQRLAPIGFLRWQRGASTLHVSREARWMLGKPEGGDLSLFQCLERVWRRALPRLRDAWQQVLSDRAPAFEIELPIVVDGQRRLLRLGAVLQYVDGALAGWLMALHDVTARSQLAEALPESRAQLDEAQEIAHVGHWEIDLRRGSAKCSREALRIYGVATDWVPSVERLIDIAPPPQRPGLREALQRAMDTRQSHIEYELAIVDSDGRTREIHGRVRIAYASNGAPVRLMGTVQDVSELTGYRRQVHSLAFFDPLTALPNRAQMRERTRELLDKAAWHNQAFGVLMLDLDRFKDVNE